MTQPQIEEYQNLKEQADRRRKYQRELMKRLYHERKAKSETVTPVATACP